MAKHEWLSTSSGELTCVCGEYIPGTDHVGEWADVLTSICPGPTNDLLSPEIVVVGVELTKDDKIQFVTKDGLFLCNCISGPYAKAVVDFVNRVGPPKDKVDLDVIERIRKRSRQQMPYTYLVYLDDAWDKIMEEMRKANAKQDAVARTAFGPPKSKPTLPGHVEFLSATKLGAFHEGSLLEIAEKFNTLIDCVQYLMDKEKGK